MNIRSRVNVFLLKAGPDVGIPLPAESYSILGIFAFQVARANDEHLKRIAKCCLVIAAFLVFVFNLRFGREAIAAGFEDDFFYYLQVAKNLAFYHRSSFDGIHATNGYHPLWIVILSVLTKLFAPGGVFHAETTVPLAFSIESVQAALFFWTARMVFEIARVQGCTVAVSCSVQLGIASISLILLRSGMESGLTLALAFSLLLFRLSDRFVWSNIHTFGYGLLASLTILSRLDAVFLVTLLFFLDVLPLVLSRKKQSLLIYFALGLLPFAAYLIFDRIVFGVFLPVSGMAKQLRYHHLPSPNALKSFMGHLFSPASPVYALCVACIPFAVYLLLRRKVRIDDHQKGIYWAALLFPPIHCLAVVSLSDWQIWRWYLYAWPIGGMVAAITLYKGTRSIVGARTRENQDSAFTLSCAAFLLYACILARATNPEHQLMYVAGKEIASFSATHPGIYAMGDRAGSAGYLMNMPLVQLEGLMMDAKYLDNIREQRDLLNVLRVYSVRYYIATRSRPDLQGCYTVREPSQAGPDSPKMLGRLCVQPVAFFQHGGISNQIFDLSQIKRGG